MGLQLPDASHRGRSCSLAWNDSFIVVPLLDNSSGNIRLLLQQTADAAGFLRTQSGPASVKRGLGFIRVSFIKLLFQSVYCAVIDGEALRRLFHMMDFTEQQLSCFMVQHLNCLLIGLILHPLSSGLSVLPGCHIIVLIRSERGAAVWSKPHSR